MPIWFGAVHTIVSNAFLGLLTPGPGVCPDRSTTRPRWAEGRLADSPWLGGLAIARMPRPAH
eukprot:5934212-Pyramimonas_sp.AAC.1